MLASNVNLAPQKPTDKVADFYELLRKPINEEIRRVGREDLKYSSLCSW